MKNNILMELKDKAIIYGNIKHLNLINALSSTPIVQNGGPTVSLTTYGARTFTVHLTIETIAQGNLRPGRIILWVDDEETLHNPPKALKRLIKRGLELKIADNFGPHKKYYPYIESSIELKTPLVTADDDVLYPKHWLEDLSNAHHSFPEAINCYIARRLLFEKNKLKPYIEWKHCNTSEASFRHFSLGVSGAIYPIFFQYALKEAGRAFLERCPKADDIWLHANAVRSGCKTRQINTRPRSFPEIPNTQEHALFHSNMWGGKNDEQIRNTYTEHDLDRILNDPI